MSFSGNNIDSPLTVTIRAGIEHLRNRTSEIEHPRNRTSDKGRFTSQV